MDNISVERIRSFLIPSKYRVIDLENNYYIFPELITSKDSIRSRNNLEVSIKNTYRSLEGVFSKIRFTVTILEILVDRTKSLK